MAFNSSSTRASGVGSSFEWSLEAGGASGSGSGRRTLSDVGFLTGSESFWSSSSSTGPTIVTPSSSQLYSSSDSASLGSSQSGQLWSRSSSFIPLSTSGSTSESFSATEVPSSVAFGSESSSVWSTLDLSSASSVSSSSVSSSWVSSSSSSSVSSSWTPDSSSSSMSSSDSSSSSVSSSWTSDSSSSSDSSSMDFSTSSSSSESVPSTSVLEPEQTSFSYSSETSASSSTSPSYTVSQDSRSVYYIYTQLYHITGSSTTFDTGLPTTTARAKTATSSFSVPTSTQTRGIQFYQNWLDGSLGGTSGPSNPTKNKIIGGVVGGVGGALLCGIVLWFMFFRRRKKAPREFTSKIGRRAGYPLPTQPLDHDQEKVAASAASNGQAALLSRIKSKISKNKSETDPRNDKGNPFQDEFNFQDRRPPPIPPSRNVTSFQDSAIPEVPVDHRFSYVSSLTDSSYVSSSQGDFSSMSSTPIRLAPDNERDHSESTQGFLREVI